MILEEGGRYMKLVVEETMKKRKEEVVEVMLVISEAQEGKVKRRRKLHRLFTCGQNSSPGIFDSFLSS